MSINPKVQEKLDKAREERHALVVEHFRIRSALDGELCPECAETVVPVNRFFAALGRFLSVNYRLRCVSCGAVHVYRHIFSK